MIDSEKKSRRSARVAGAAAVISGTRYIVWNFKFLRERLSMPFLQKNIKSLYANAKNPQQPALSALTVAQLSRSIISHRFLQIAFTLICVYSLIVTARGVAAIVRFDVLTQWLLAGPLLIVIAVAQIAISTKSLSAQRAERAARSIK